jgi:transposase
VLRAGCRGGGRGWFRGRSRGVTESLPPGDPRDALIREQEGQIAALTALVAELREQLDAALRAVSRNSGNSSMPPSADDLPGRRPPARRERRAAERTEKKRKPGKQPGSPGTAMRWEKPDKVVDYFPQGDCACGADLAGAADLGVARSYQQQDVPEPRPAVRYQHDLHKARCACGKVHVAARPAGVPDAPLSVGPRLSAMAVYLSVFQHVPVQRAQFLIAGLTGGVLSAGFVHSCLGKAAGLVTDAVRLIRTLIAAAPVAGFDETTLRSGPAGDKKYVHGAFTELYSAFWLGTRSLETMREAGILPSFAGIVVSDRYQGYYSETWTNFAGHQACAAHVIRDFQDCAETYPQAGWPEQAIRSLRGLIRAWHAAREQGLPAIPAEDREPPETEFRRAVTVGLATVSRVPGPKNQTRQQPGRHRARGHPDRVMAQRGDPDGYLGGGRLAQAQRARGRGVAELGGLAGHQRTDLGHDVAQLGGWMLECGVVEPLHQHFGAGAQAQDVPPAADLMEGGGGHR